MSKKVIIRIDFSYYTMPIRFVLNYENVNIKDSKIMIKKNPIYDHKKKKGLSVFVIYFHNVKTLIPRHPSRFIFLVLPYIHIYLNGLGLISLPPLYPIFDAK